jgi:uncharacterized FlaG/YvyC family protein
MSAITPLLGSPTAAAPVEPGAATQYAPRAAPAPEPSKPAPKFDLEAAQRATADLQQTIDDYAKEPRDVAMRYDDKHDVFVIEIRERESGEMILEFPPEKILNVRDRLDELIGAMIDRKT